MQNRHLLPTLQLLGFLCFATTALGQAPTIITDRPDQTESTSIVPPHYLQGEFGFAMQDNDGEQSFSHPSTLLRLGLTERWEARLALEPTTAKFNGKSKSGLAPVVLGSKTRLVDEKGALPDIAFLFNLQLSGLASEHLRADYFASAFRLLMQHTLSERWSLGYNLGMAWDGFTPEPVFEYTLSASSALTESLGCFFEVYGSFPQKTDLSDHNFDTGLTLVLRPNLQFDLSGGIGLTEDAPNYFVSTGVSFRLPN